MIDRLSCACENEIARLISHGVDKRCWLGGYNHQ